MRVEEAPSAPVAAAPHQARPARTLVIGIALGIIGCALIGAVIAGPAILAKRGDLPLERVYGDFAVSIASRIGGGNQQNPVASDRRALAAGRDAYTGSCAVCHGANGDGRGVLGTSSYPNATDLRSHDAVEKSDAQLFWIIKNGLNFTGMPGFADQYSDQDIWSMVSFIRALQDPNQAQPNGGGSGGGAQPPAGGQPNQGQPGQPQPPAAGAANGANPAAGANAGQPPAAAGAPNGANPAARGNAGQRPGGGNPRAEGQAGGRGPGGRGEGSGEEGGQAGGFAGFQFQAVAANVPATTPDQYDRADPLSPDPAARGAALYFAQGCDLCHGAVGNAPANLGLARGGGPEATRAIRQGRPGMPSYSTALLTDAELSDLQAYLATIGSAQRRGD